MKILKFGIFLWLIAFSLVSCDRNEPIDEDFHFDITDSLLLPEQLVAEDKPSGMKAQYIYPTTRYDHGILGDAIEGGGLLVDFKAKQYIFELDSTLVFEDLQPRLVDFDSDGIPEIVTILTKIGQGASVAIFKIENDEIRNFASNDFIGTAHRWLNIAAINDFDNDGEIEIAYVTTPHIGGDLHIARVEGNKLKVLANTAGVSNHKIRSRNLCLSVVSVSEGIKTLYLPNNEFNAILGFQWRNGKLIPVDTISFIVDPFVSLFNQYQFTDLQNEQDCINAE